MVRAADREDRSGIGEMRVRQLPRAGDGCSYSCVCPFGQRSSANCKRGEGSEAARGEKKKKKKKKKKKIKGLDGRVE